MTCLLLAQDTQVKIVCVSDLLVIIVQSNTLWSVLSSQSHGVQRLHQSGKREASIWDVLINGGAKKDTERCQSGEYPGVNLPKTKHSLWKYLPFQKESSVTFQHFQGQDVSFAECSPIPDQLTIVPGIVSSDRGTLYTWWWYPWNHHEFVFGLRISRVHVTFY